MKLIIGLGNPGRQYQKTRHNVGFVIADALHEELKLYGISDWSLSKKFNAKIATVNIRDQKIILAKPMTFMNKSGESVQLIMQYYKIKPEDLIIIHDDKDLPLEQVKLQKNRSDAGHNGIKSIIENIGTKNFARFRVGIASDNEKKMRHTSKFVLGKFGLMEKKNWKRGAEKTVKMIKKELEN
jgi:peptidyl-tRNA hydrolase, PTH1 family